MVRTANAVEARAASTNPLVAIVEQGQSLWLDYITRDLVRGGELRQLIEEDGLRGLTSNPTIFEKAIGEGDAYNEQLAGLAGQGKDAKAIFEALMVTDIREACDLFRPVFDRTEGRDGLVSIEVAPGLARDTAGTLEEARRLWRTVDRPNAMVKVPGTAAGLPAIEQLLVEGVNVNVTLLFSRLRHEQVMLGYLAALQERALRGEPIARLVSVASFFLSRIDTAVDTALEARIAATGDAAERGQLRGLLGRAAIANARLAYATFRAIFDGDRFAQLRERGARPQRPLWASTGTKNPAYGDVLYVEALIGPDTVNTLPQPTLAAFRDHGRARRTLDGDVEGSRATLAALAEAGIDLDAVTRRLEDEGVAAFAKSYDVLLAGIARKCEALQREEGNAA
jgi:transaldolase